MTKQDYIVRLDLILLQMRKERAYVKTKPYSMTLTEQLREDVTQLKLQL